MNTLSFTNRRQEPCWLELKEFKNFNIASASGVGCHGPHSPVLGTRVEDLQRIYEGIEKEPILGQFEDALYYRENSSSFNFLIPIEKKEEANRISRDIFLQYIEKYTVQNEKITENTIILWSPIGLWENRSPGLSSIVQPMVLFAMQSYHHNPLNF